MAGSNSDATLLRSSTLTAVPHASSPIRRPGARTYRAETTTHTRPVTPDQRSSLCQLVQVNVPVDATLEGSIKLRASRQSSAQKETIVWHSPAQRSDSLNATANTRVRRCNYGAKLLQSPARAGYAERMRQMFEEAGNGHHEQQNSMVGLYPQLPNISRKAMLSPTRSPKQNGLVGQVSASVSPRYRPESPCLSTNIPLAVSSPGAPHASLLNPSERSSGSWSDDSGYILTTRVRSCTSDVPLDERIHIWLLELPGLNMNAAHSHTDEALHLAPNISHSHDSNNPIPSEQLVQHDTELSFPTEDPFVSNSNAQTRTFRQNESPTTVRNIPSVCELLIVDNHDPVRTVPLNEKLSPSPTKYEHCQHAGKRPNDNGHVEQGDIQLNPLSPNVCVERGPSRYHSLRKPDEMNTTETPSKTRSSTTFRAPRLKENVVMKKAHCPGGTDPPLTPRGDRFGTRFRRPQW